MGDFIHFIYGGMPQLIGLISAIVIWLGLGAIGRVATGPNGFSVASPIYGWGLAVGFFVVFGVLTPISFTVLSVVFAFVAVVAAIIVLRRDGLAVLALPAKAFVLALPLILMVSAMAASQWDEFSHWLPSTRFLLLADGFPNAAQPTTGASFPAYPYGWPLLMYFGARLTGAVQENVGPILNLFMLINFGMVIIELVRRQLDVQFRTGAWSSVAIGILLVTVLNPSFVQKLVLTAYSETSTMIAAGLVAILAWLLLNKLASDDQTGLGSLAWQWALVGIVLVSTRQPNIVILVIVVFSMLVVTLRDPALQLVPVGRAVAIALIPPIVVFLTWRFHVAVGLSGREFTIRPYDGWFLDLIPEILSRMALVASKKGVYFGAMLIVLAFGIRALFRCRTPMDRLAIVASGAFLGYNTFLFFTYVAAFGKGDALRAASYWRYNTHVSLIGLTFVAIGIAYLWFNWEGGQRWRRYVPRLAIILLLVLPLVFSPKIRFDLEPPKPHFRTVAAALESEMVSGARFVTIDPKGTGESNVITRYHLWPDRIFVGHISAFHDKSAANIVRVANQRKPTHLVVHSVTENVRVALGAPLAEDRSYLMELKDGKWVVLAQWPYPANHRN